MKKKLVFIGILILLQSISYAKFEDGYIIKAAGDTVFGKLKVFSEARSSVQIIFKQEDKEIIEFGLNDAIGYKRGEDIYVKRFSYSIVGGVFFMKLVEDGNVKLYRHQANPLVNFNPKYANTTASETFCYLESNKKSILVSKHKKTAKEQLVEFFADDPKFVASITKKKISYEDLQQLVKSYNKMKK